MDRLQEILARVVRVLNEEIIVKSKIFPLIAFFINKSMKRDLQEPTKKPV